MKECKWCKNKKPFSDFYKSKNTKDGCQSHCKECHSLYNSKKYYDNHEENRARLSKYYYENHEKEKKYRRNHYNSNKAKYLANFYKREDRIKIATPNWLTKEMFLQIEEIYKKRIEISNMTGIQYHVDHIVPIQGENVCGLHVPWNLQIITAEENLKKSNKYE